MIDVVALPCLWFRNGDTVEPLMTVDLSIKRVPVELARRLRRRAELHHRSLQGELMAIVQAAVAAADGTPDVPDGATSARPRFPRAGGRRGSDASESVLITLHPDLAEAAARVARSEATSERRTPGDRKVRRSGRVKRKRS